MGYTSCFTLYRGIRLAAQVLHTLMHGCGWAPGAHVWRGFPAPTTPLFSHWVLSRLPQLITSTEATSVPTPSLDITFCRTRAVSVAIMDNIYTLSKVAISFRDGQSLIAGAKKEGQFKVVLDYGIASLSMILACRNEQDRLYGYVSRPRSQNIKFCFTHLPLLPGRALESLLPRTQSPSSARGCRGAASPILKWLKLAETWSILLT